MDHGWEVVLAHFEEAVVVKRCLIFGWTDLIVIATVDVTPIISDPDIEATLQKLDRDGSVADPDEFLGVFEEAVLQEDGWAGLAVRFG